MLYEAEKMEDKMMRKRLWEIYREFPDCKGSYYGTISIDKLFGKEAILSCR